MSSVDIKLGKTTPQIGKIQMCISVEYIWGDDMHRRWKEIMLAFFFGIVLPSMLFSALQKKQVNKNQQSLQSDTTSSQTAKDTSIFLPVLLDDGTVTELKLEDYLVAVVLQEMPAEFEMEALKAQAVVARTYALRRYKLGSKHENAAVCTDSGCCQGYCLPENYLHKGGTQVSVDKITAAVQATAGEVLTYEDSLIEATYFSCSGGMTEDAAAVWGSEVPYLVATKSPGEESAAYFVNTVTYTTEEFARMLGISLPEMTDKWIKTISHTAGGGVEEINICGRLYKGTTVRQKLGLRSTAFTIAVVGNTVTVTTKGFGHRVGMSQYGADAMAVQGSTYEQILTHYYQGVDLAVYSGD